MCHIRETCARVCDHVTERKVLRNCGKTPSGKEVQCKALVKEKEEDNIQYCVHCAQALMMLVR